ncbi:MAG: Ig-like domain-containing protein [Oscillospiraceae bacterium]
MGKKFIKSFMSVLLALMMIVTVAAVPASAKKIAISKSSVSVVKGCTVTLSVMGTSDKVKWSSDDKTIATVSSKGKVTGKKLGSTTVRATVGDSVLKCKVTVKAGSIATNGNKFSVDKGKTVDVSVNAIGTHDLAVSTADKSIATAALSKDGFNGNITTVNVKGISDGTTKIKIYSKSYEKSVYKYVEIKVGTGKVVSTVSKSGLDISVNYVEVNENLTAEFTVGSSSLKLQDLNISSTAKHNFDVETAIDSEKNVINVKVSGFVEGTGNVMIDSLKDKKLSVSIPVTVTNNAYDVAVWNREPNKRTRTDVVYKLVNSSDQSFYVLEPKDCDPAHAATVLAEAADWYDYYTVYEKTPSKQEKDDIILNKTVNYGGKKVTRYVLVPNGYDEAYSNSAFAMYSGEYEYYTVYANKPDLQVRGDSLCVYEVTPHGMKEAEKRFILTKGEGCEFLADEAWEKYKKTVE